MFKLKKENGIYYLTYIPTRFCIICYDLAGAMRHLKLAQGILAEDVQAITQVMRQGPRIGGMTLNIIARAMKK